MKRCAPVNLKRFPNFDETVSRAQLVAVLPLTHAARVWFRRIFRRFGLLLLGGVFLPAWAQRPPLVHTGMANASAAVRAGTNLFLTGADDDNVIKLYRSDVAGGPLAQFDASPWLGLEGHSRDANIEGAARIGDVVYWLGSHARNKDGRTRPNRQRLFATRVTENTNGISLTLVGQPCQSLLNALTEAPQLALFHLDDAAGRAPETEVGLNLEGLSAMPTGGLLLGFRGPVPEGKTLLVPLLNPVELMNGQPPKLGEPILLNLGGLGIRDIAWTGREYFIIAGNSGRGGTSQLWRWAGGEANPKRIGHAPLHRLNPEGIAVFGSPEKPRLLIVSDDGNHNDAALHPFSGPMFRTVWVKP